VITFGGFHCTNKIIKNRLCQYPVSGIGEHDRENFFSEKVEKLFGQIASHDSAKTVSDDSDVFGRTLDEKDEKKISFRLLIIKIRLANSSSNQFCWYRTFFICYIQMSRQR
jgi:hypothetical protein